MTHEPRDPLAGLRPPGPSPEMKGRVLAAARAAAAAGDRRTIWDVLWESRVTRASWATISLALIVAHLLLPPSAGSALPTGPERAGPTGIPPELEEEVKLPEVAAEAPAFASVENETGDQTGGEKGSTS